MVKLTAIMRQSWFESVKINLKPMERLAFYEAIFEFEFYEIDPSETLEITPNVKFAFDFVKGDIEEDMRKARAIIRRNQENGKKGGRPPKTETTELPNSADEQSASFVTQKNPSNPEGISNNIYTYTNNNTNYYSKNEEKNLYEERKGVEKMTNTERWQIKLDFFARGVKNPLFEIDRFCSYYEDRGWKGANNKPIDKPVLLARKWSCANIEDDLIPIRRDWARVIQTAALDYDPLLIDFVSLKVDKGTRENTIYICFAGSKRCVDFCEDNLILLAEAFGKLLITNDKPIKLEYRVLNEQKLL